MEARLDEVFRAVLELDDGVDVRDLVRGESERWDSLAHVLLVTGVESEFGVAVDVEEALELLTFSHFRDLLERKGVEGAHG